MDKKVEVDYLARAYQVLWTLNLDQYNNGLTLPQFLDLLGSLTGKPVHLREAAGLPSTVSGLSFLEEALGYFILLNPTYRGADVRHTIAHEAGHILLGHIAPLSLSPAQRHNLLSSSPDLTELLPWGDLCHRSLQLEWQPAREEQAELLGSMLALKLVSAEEQEFNTALDQWKARV